MAKSKNLSSTNIANASEKLQLLLVDTSPRNTITGAKKIALNDAAQSKIASRLETQKKGAEALVTAIPNNPLKATEFGLKSGHAPAQGKHIKTASPVVTASSVTEDTSSEKVGAGKPQLGLNPANASLDGVRVDSGGQALTTNMGLKISDNQNSLKAGLRGPTLLEDFVLREKITHFDHERIPERIVHARG